MSGWKFHLVQVLISLIVLCKCAKLIFCFETWHKYKWALSYVLAKGEWHCFELKIKIDFPICGSSLFVFILQSLVLSVTMIDFFQATNFHTFGAKSCSVTMINFGALFPGCNWFWWKLVTMINFGALFLSPGKPGHQLSQFWRKILLSRQSWFYSSSFSFPLSPLEICA